MQVLGPGVTNYTSRVVTAAAFIDQTLVIQPIGWPYLSVELAGYFGAMKSSPTQVSPTTTTLHGSLPARAGARFVALTAVLISQFGSLRSRILRFLRKYSPSRFSPEIGERSFRNSPKNGDIQN